MAIDPELAAIDKAMAEKGYKRADLGRLLELDSSQVTRMFKGQRRLQRHEHAKVMAWLKGVPAAEVAARAGSVVPMPGMVPLFGFVGAASESRLTLAEQNLRGYVPMHPNQQHVREPFALEVADVSMVPRYEPGEIVYLAPNRWPARNQDCVLVTTDSEGFLKRFVQRTAESVILHQLNPDQDLTFDLPAVQAMHAVVGRG